MLEWGYSHLRLTEYSSHGLYSVYCERASYAHVLLQLNLSYREIGRRMDRAHTTISREVKRNGRLSGCYSDVHAEKLANHRKKKPRHSYRKSNPDLYRYVEAALRNDWSPETIAGRLRLDCQRSTTMRVSPETIYQWIFNDAKSGGDLYRHLLRRHKTRRKQAAYGSCRGLIPNRIGLDRRPPGAENRSRYGHWESDSVLGRKGTGAIATHVERKSRYTVATKLDNQRADEYLQSTLVAFSKIPLCWKKSTTVDNGKEFADFKTIEESTGMTVFFCDPYSSWQRGTNENTNGLLRHYFPKGIDWQKE